MELLAELADLVGDEHAIQWTGLRYRLELQRIFLWKRVLTSSPVCMHENNYRDAQQLITVCNMRLQSGVAGKCLRSWHMLEKPRMRYITPS